MFFLKKHFIIDYFLEIAKIKKPLCMAINIRAERDRGVARLYLL